MEDAAFSSALLDAFLESDQKNLNISYLIKCCPNLIELEEDSPILKMGPCCENLETTEKTSFSFQKSLESIKEENNLFPETSSPNEYESLPKLEDISETSTTLSRSQPKNSCQNLLKFNSENILKPDISLLNSFKNTKDRYITKLGRPLKNKKEHVICNDMTLLKDSFGSKSKNEQNKILNAIQILSQNLKVAGSSPQKLVEQTFDEEMVKLALTALPNKINKLVPIRKRLNSSPIENILEMKPKRSIKLPARYLNSEEIFPNKRPKLSNDSKHSIKNEVFSSSQSEKSTSPSSKSEEMDITKEYEDDSDIELIQVLDKDAKLKNIEVVDICSDDESEVKESSDPMKNLLNQFALDIPEMREPCAMKNTDNIISQYILKQNTDFKTVSLKILDEKGKRFKLAKKLNSINEESKNVSNFPNKSKVLTKLIDPNMKFPQFEKNPKLNQLLNCQHIAKAKDYLESRSIATQQSPMLLPAKKFVRSVASSPSNAHTITSFNKPIIGKCQNIQKPPDVRYYRPNILKKTSRNGLKQSLTNVVSEASLSTLSTNVFQSPTNPETVNSNIRNNQLHNSMKTVFLNPRDVKKFTSITSIKLSSPLTYTVNTSFISKPSLVLNTNYTKDETSPVISKPNCSIFPNLLAHTKNDKFLDGIEDSSIWHNDNGEECIITRLNIDEEMK